MRSPAFRFTIGAAAWIALGVAAFLLVRSEQQIKDLSTAARAFDQRAREAIDALADARLSQQAYVAAGQGIGFWMPKVTSNSEMADAALAALRTSAGEAARAPLDQATESAKAFGNVERRVREYLKAGQQLMAGDVIYTEGTQAATAAMRQVEMARRAESQSFDAVVGVLRYQEAVALGAAGAVALLVVLVLAFKPREKTSAIETPPLSIAPTASIAPAPRPAPAPEPTNTEIFKNAATLATDFGRVRDLDELTRLLGRAAELIDASGVMVWISSAGGSELRPVLAHGYGADMLARIPAVARSADNAAAKAFRSGTLQIVLARPGQSTGAVVAPILSAAGCIGALSAEIRHGAETSETIQSLATMMAAHLSAVVAQAPAETDEATAVQG
ncbi:MAG TPA: hypothetical protein VKD69_14415 [Vicinamibacterales bacterium]|nr:hypothetical protein [Vicinamibacterales bacterium]